ncbi:MAG: tetratricopeptide repeat protein [Nostoc sp. S4]|nr:tetratricopeptide repeat protein [Nostoc sp. S4]
MKITHLIMGLSWIGGVSNVTLYTEVAQAQINIQQIATKTCAVMAGQQKPDQQSFRYLLLLDDDEAFGSGNPVALALSQAVLKQCPQAYINFQHRKRVSNPFAPGSLVKPNQTQLYHPESGSSNSPTSSVDMTTYDEAVQLHPNDIKVYIARGNARYERKDYQGAITDYTQIIRLEPKNPRGYANRGLARQNLGDQQGAIADWQMGLKLFKAQGDQSSYQKVQEWLREAKASTARRK